MTSTTNENLSTSQRACVFCNTTRPIEQVLCPSCGRGWIDTSAVDAVESVAKAEAAAIRTITTDKALPVRRSTYRKGWWIPLLVALIVFGGYWAVVNLVDGEPTTDAAPAPPSTLAPTTTAPVASPPTTLATTTLPPATTTTTAPATTTTTTTTTLAPLPIGTAIPIDDLRLGAVELGDLAFGTPADEVLPDLVATFGQPTAIADASTAWGLCSDYTGRVVTFGGLHIVTVNDGATERFAGFVVDRAGTASDDLQSFSGIGVGSTIAELTDTYRSTTIDAGETSTVWIVTSVNDGRTLLWGTAAGADEQATIDRIASPNPCDGGPTATG